METHLSASPSSLPALPKIFGKSSRAITHIHWSFCNVHVEPGHFGSVTARKTWNISDKSTQQSSHQSQHWNHLPVVLFVLLKQNPTKQHGEWISCLLTWRVCGLVVFLVLSHKAGGLVKCLVCSCHENMTWNCSCYGWTVYPTMWNSNV